MTGEGRTAGDRPRWNADTQRWESGEAPAAYRPPPPPLPLFAPYGPDASDGGSGPGHDGAGAGGPRGGPWGAGSRRTTVVVIAVAAVLGAGSVAAWLSWGRDAASDEASPQPGVSATDGSYATDVTDAPSVTDDPAATESTEGTGDPGDPGSASLPPGFRVAEDPKGFNLAVPEGWERTSGSTGVFYTAPDELSLIQVFTIAEEGMTSEELVRQSSANLDESNDGYTEAGVGAVSGGDENPAGDAAELVYSYDSEKTGGRRQGIERVFTAIDGQRYAVLVAAPAGEISSQRRTLETALEHFEPGWS